MQSRPEALSRTFSRFLRTSLVRTSPKFLTISRHSRNYQTNACKRTSQSTTVSVHARAFTSMVRQQSHMNHARSCSCLPCATTRTHRPSHFLQRHHFSGCVRQYCVRLSNISEISIVLPEIKTDRHKKMKSLSTRKKLSLPRPVTRPPTNQPYAF